MEVKNISQAGKPAGAPLQNRANPPHRILVVEDDQYVRELGTELLLRSGYEVDSAADGAAAWEALNEDYYDLMITDNKMPKVTGVELLKKLRAARMALPVIMATGVLPTEEFTRYPWLQPAATLLKPYTANELLAKVRNVLHGIDTTPVQFAPPASLQARPLPNRLPL